MCAGGELWNFINIKTATAESPNPADTMNPKLKFLLLGLHANFSSRRKEFHRGVSSLFSRVSPKQVKSEGQSNSKV